MRLLALLLLASTIHVDSHAAPALDFDGLTGKAFVFPAFKKPPLPTSPRKRGEGIIVASPSAAVVSEQALFDTLSRADLIFIGEQHDQPSHHNLQALVLKRLAAARPNIQVAFEMLDVTQQAALDDFLAGRTPEADFAEFWKKTWGYPYEIYKPIFDAARAARLKGRALNAPISVVRQVSKGGIASLKPEQRALLPKDIRPITDARYLAYVKRSLSEHGPMPPGMEARMLEAMAVWNETMGQTLVDALRDGPVVVVAGMGHIFYNAGILESVRTRSGAAQKTVLPYPMDGTTKPAEELLRALKDPTSADIQLGDFFYLNPR